MTLPTSRLSEMQATRPPDQITSGGTARPHDIDGQADLDRVLARALAGQVTPICKKRTRAHYEAALATLRGEQEAGHA